MRIDGGIDRGYTGSPAVYCNFVIIRDLEMWSTEWANPITSQQSGSWPSDIPSNHGGGFSGRNAQNGGNLAINCIVHNAFGGLDSWMEEPNFLAYGNIVYKIGWMAPDRGHGHCVYTQNTSTPKTYSNNIFQDQYDGTECMQAYGSISAQYSHYMLDHNINTHGSSTSTTSFLVGGEGTSDDEHILSNINYQCSMNAGYDFSTNNVLYEVRDNYIVGADLQYWKIINLQESNNTVVNGNVVRVTAGGATNDPQQPVPTTPKVFVMPNSYDPLRGHLVIFNWATDANVLVDFQGLVPAGTNFKLMDPFNFYGAPLFVGTGDANGCASIPTPTLFNEFVVLRTSGRIGPIVNAGSNQTVRVPTSSVTLTGTVTDDAGYTAAPTWSLVSGPAAMIVTPNALSTTVNLTGGPGVYIFRLMADDGSMNYRSDVQVTLIGNAAPIVNAGSNQSAAPMTPVTLAGTVSDDGLPVGASLTYTWSMSSGPGTVTFANANALSTTATFSTAGLYVIRLTVGDTNLSGWSELSVSIGGGVPYGGVPWAVPGIIQAENYDLGGEGVAYHDTDPNQNTGGAYRPTEGVDIRAINDPNNPGYLVKDIYTGEWLNYTISVPATGGYIISVYTAGTYTPRYVHFNLDGANLTGQINLLTTIDWDHFTPASSSAVTIPAGIHTLRLCFDTGDFNVDYFTVASTTPINQAPAITMPANVITSMPGAASAGAVALNATVSDDGLANPVVFTWSVLSAPANGVVTFTNATAAGTTASFTRVGAYTLQLDANDGALHTAKTMTVTVQLDPRADFDKNGVVDGLDFLAWQRSYNHGTAASGAPIVDANFNDPNYAKANGDANGDGKTDGQDFLIWQQDYVYGH